MSTNFLRTANAGLFAELATQFPNSWVVTLTAAKLELGHLAGITQLLAQISPSLRMLYQTTMVHELAWQVNANLPQSEQVSPVTTIQWVITGQLTSSVKDFTDLISSAIASYTLYPIDVNVMPITTFTNPHKLALFDMDSTLIEQEVIVELAKKAGIGEQVNLITESAMRGEIDFNESFRRRVALLKGLDSAVLEDIINHHLSFSLGAKRLITALKSNGYHVVLVSGGFDCFATYVQTQLGIDEIYANRLNIANGKLTGEITSPIVDGKRKAEILQQVATRLNIPLTQTVAVGDGANDLPMLGLADIGIAYRAKPIVQQQAKYTINISGLDGVMGLLGLAVSST